METLPGLTPRAKHLLDAAGSIAASKGHDYVGTEHLLLALCDGEGVAGAAMDSLGVRSDLKNRVNEIIASEAYKTVEELPE